LGVEGEVVLGDLAVAFAFRVGYQELFCVSDYFLNGVGEREWL
jgi:hypothetical protein